MAQAHIAAAGQTRLVRARRLVICTIHVHESRNKIFRSCEWYGRWWEPVRFDFWWDRNNSEYIFCDKWGFVCTATDWGIVEWGLKIRTKRYIFTRIACVWWCAFSMCQHIFYLSIWWRKERKKILLRIVLLLEHYCTTDDSILIRRSQNQRFIKIFGRFSVRHQSVQYADSFCK